MNKAIKIFVILFFSLFFAQSKESKILYDLPIIRNTPTINVSILNNPEPGYLFIGVDITDMGIVDNYGNSIDSAAFRNIDPGFDFKIQGNGDLTFFSSRSNMFYSLNSNFTIKDSFSVPEPYKTDFHNLCINSDGSYLIFGDDIRHVDMSTIVDGGDKNAVVRGIVIFEFDKNKNQIWKWSTWDHFKITDATSDINLTINEVDYCHINSVEKDLADGNIIISSRHMDEITKIDRSTGKIIWRMGGERCKNNQFTFINDKTFDFIGFTHQHDVKRLANGNLLLFDNGNYKPIEYSRAVEYKIDEINKTVTRVWDFKTDDNYFNAEMGSVQRLTNGNTLINFKKRIYEVNKNNQVVFYGTIGNNAGAFKAYKYVYNMDAVSKIVISSGNYEFSDNTNQTNVNLDISSFSNNGRISIEKHNYIPKSLPFQNFKPSKILNYRWVISGEVSSFNGKLTINTQNLVGFNLKDTFLIFARDAENNGSFVQLTSKYNSSNKTLIADLEKGGEFIIANNKSLPSIAPNLKFPANSSLLKLDSTFRWNSTLGADKYKIQISTTSNFSTLIVDEFVDKLSFVLTNIENGNIYFWRVQAYNIEFNYFSPWSDVWSFRTFIDIPKLLEPINNSINISYLTGSLKWTQVNYSLNYALEVSEDSTFINNLLKSESLVFNTYLYQSLKPFTKYYWRVAAINGDGFTDWSNVFQFKTALTIPKLVSPLNKSLGVEVSSQLVYEKSLESDYFQFQISKFFDFNQIEQEGFTSKTQNTNFTKLASFTKHFWRVRAIHNSDTSDWSEIYQFTTQIVVPKLQYPTNYAINELQDIGLRWELINGANNYEISLSDNISFNSAKTFTNISNILTISGLKPLQEYYWKVKANYTGGNSSWSEIWKFKTGPSPTLNKPILLLPNNSTIDLAKNVVLSWLKVLNAENYRVQVSKNIDFDEFEQDSLTNYFESLLLNLENERTYYWRVQAQSSKAISLWSEIRNFTIGGKSIPSFPLSILPKNKAVIADSLVTFVWNKVENAIEYGLIIAEDIEFIKNHQEYTKIVDTTKSIMLLTNKTYFWKLYSKTSKVQSLDSPIYSFRLISDINSVFDIRKNKFEIYPNPVCDVLQIDLFDDDFNGKMTVFNSVGLEMKSINVVDNLSRRIAIDCSEFCPGIYIIEFSNSNQKNAFFFIKN